MSLLESRQYYKPFDYPWAYEYYKQQNQMHWLPEEVPLTEDLRDFRDKLTEDERSLLLNLFTFFTQSDSDVAGGYAGHYLPKFQPPEVRMMLSAFANMEGVHQDAYSLLLETLGLPDSMYQEFLDIQEMVEKHEFLHNFGTKTVEDTAKTLAVFSAFTEGVQLFSSFAILLNFPRNNLMKNMGQIITWSVRDESLHVEAMSRLFKEFIRENPEIWTDKLKFDIYTAAEKTVQLEDAFIDVCFGKCQVVGLTKEEVKEYIRYIADRRLLGIGMKAIFKSTINPLPWLDYILNGVEHTNFFENRATEYARSSTTGNWADIFKG